MAASPPATASRKRPRASHGFCCECFGLDFENDVHSSCNKRKGLEFSEQHNFEVSASSSSSSCAQPAYISSAAKEKKTHDDVGRESYTRSYTSSPLLEWEWGSATAFADMADSTTGSSSLLECEGAEQLLCRVSSDEEADSCCGGDDTSEVDIACFLHEVGVGAEYQGGEAFSFNPETIFLDDGTSADCSEDAALTGCFAENGNWFLNDFGSQGHAFLNEVLDQEWMAAAVANLDRFNDVLETDSCVLHLLESDHAGADY